MDNFTVASMAAYSGLTTFFVIAQSLLELIYFPRMVWAFYLAFPSILFGMLWAKMHDDERVSRTIRVTLGIYCMHLWFATIAILPTAMASMTVSDSRFSDYLLIYVLTLAPVLVGIGFSTSQ
jgi:hypothetical protein